MSRAALSVLFLLGACSSKPDPAKEGWSFVQVPGARCGRSTDFGIGLNRAPSDSSSKRLLLFFLGGGACFDDVTCAAACDGKARLCAANLDGYTEKKFAQGSERLPDTIFDRTSPNNPFRGDSWVFVPYCTGDFHAGAARGEYGVEHTGWENIGLILSKIIPEFPNIDQVVLYGVSAGGFGAVFNYERVQEAFGAKIRVDLLDDSGPTFSRALMPLQEEMRRAWSSSKFAPAGCKNCGENWGEYFPYLSQKYPQARFALATYAEDPVIQAGFGGPLSRGEDFRRALETFTATSTAANVSFFVREGRGHVLAKESLTRTTGRARGAISAAEPLTFGAFLTKLVQ